MQHGLGRIHRGGLAGTQPLIDLDEGLLPVVGGGVLFDGGQDALVVAEELADLRVGLDAQRTDQGGDGQLAVFVDADIEDIVDVRLIFQPGAAVRDHGAGMAGLFRAVVVQAVIDARGTDDLGDDDTLRAVDDKGAAVGHELEIAHEDLLLLDLFGLLVPQTDADLQRGGIGGIPLLALDDAVFRGVLQRVIQEGQFQVAGIVRNGAHIFEDGAQPLVQEPLIGFLLDFNEVWHLQDFIRPGKALADLLTAAKVFHRLPHSISLFWNIRRLIRPDKLSVSRPALLPFAAKCVILKLQKARTVPMLVQFFILPCCFSEVNDFLLKFS